MKTYMAKPKEIEMKWYLIDAAGKTLGRLATEVATLLRGKHKPIYTPHLDTGDHVIIINAEKVKVTGKKLDQKQKVHHTGYPGGLKTIDYRTLLATRPEKAVFEAIRGMVPHNRLGRAQMKKLRVYRNGEHPHHSQNPEVWELRA